MNTGAVVVGPGAPVTLSAVGARRLTDQIATDLRRSLEGLAAARAGRAWEALGYPDWHTYCEAEFGSLAELRLPVVERRALGESMTAAGLSTRERARRLGISVGLAHSDVRGAAPLRVVEHDPYAGMTRSAEALARVTAQGGRGLTSVELDAETGWPMGTATATLCKLERRGLVCRPGVMRRNRGAYVATLTDSAG